MSTPGPSGAGPSPGPIPRQRGRLRRALRAVHHVLDALFSNGLFMAAWCALWAVYDYFIFTNVWLRWGAVALMGSLAVAHVWLWRRRRYWQRQAEAMRQRFLLGLVLNGVPRPIALRVDELIDADRPQEAGALLGEFLDRVQRGTAQ